LLHGARPEKIFLHWFELCRPCAGTGKEPPPEPVVFSKFVTALRGYGEPIVLPRLSDQVDFEAELVVVIGAGGRHMRRQALAHVAGYTCGNDVRREIGKTKTRQAMAAG